MPFLSDGTAHTRIQDVKHNRQCVSHVQNPFHCDPPPLQKVEITERVLIWDLTFWLTSTILFEAHASHIFYMQRRASHISLIVHCILIVIVVRHIVMAHWHGT